MQMRGSGLLVQASVQETNCYSGFRASIDKLRKDNHTLKEELYLENKFSITPIDTAASHRITAMQDEADALTRKVCRTQATVAKAQAVSKCHQVLQLLSGFADSDRATKGCIGRHGGQATRC